MKFTITLLAGLLSASARLRREFTFEDRTFEVPEVPEHEIPDTWETYKLSHQERVDFLAYTAKESKHYVSETEFSKRAFQWHLSDGVIKAANVEKRLFKMSHNKFSDWTQDEKQDILTLRRTSNFEFNTGRLNNVARTEKQFHSSDFEDDDDDLEQSLKDYYAEMAEDDDSYDPGLMNTNCDDGYYYHRRWRRCRRCSSGCKTCTSRRSCSECMNDEMTMSRGSCSCPNGPLNDDNTCGDSCPAGYYFHSWSGRCRRCGWNCNSCEKWYECTSCDNGFTPRRGFCYCTSGNYGPNFECLGGECDSNQYKVGEVCQNCPSNCATCEDETGVCNTCEASYELDTTTGSCSCPAGTNDTGSECVTCTVGQYWTGSECSPCAVNCIECDDATAYCRTCASGFVSTGTECECPTGTYQQNNECIAIPECAAGQYWNGAQYVCQDCWDNCAVCEDYSGICQECTDTTYWINGSYCQCDDGFFDTGSGCTEYITCRDGTYVDYTTNTCLDCGANCVRCTAGTGVCEECAADTYVSSDNMSCYDRSAECPYPYGPVDMPAGCIYDPYSSERIIAPYAGDVTEVDWRDWGIVNAVRDQSSCGSCWAFMATSNAETMYAIKYGPLLELSEQQLVSCDTGNYGCNGGWPTDAYAFWKTNGVIDRAAYPYTNNEAVCYQDQINERLFYTNSPNSHVDVTGASMFAFKDALRNGSVGVAFGVADEFYYYSSGVFTGGCASGVNHGMVAVGFGYDDTESTEYVIVRNSWGSGWGESGYVRVKMGADDAYGGVCDVYLYPNYPVIA